MKHAVDVTPRGHESPANEQPRPLGGPEMVESIFAMVRRDPGLAALHLFGEFYVTAAADAVDRIIEQTPNEARYFAGFVGWQRGELASELEAGYWLVTEPDAALLSRKDTGAMWEELVKRIGPAPSGPAPSRGRELRT